MKRAVWLVALCLGCGSASVADPAAVADSGGSTPPMEASVPADAGHVGAMQGDAGASEAGSSDAANDAAQAVVDSGPDAVQPETGPSPDAGTSDASDAAVADAAPPADASDAAPTGCQTPITALPPPDDPSGHVCTQVVVQPSTQNPNNVAPGCPACAPAGWLCPSGYGPRWLGGTTPGEVVLGSSPPAGKTLFCTTRSDACLTGAIVTGGGGNTFCEALPDGGYPIPASCTCTAGLSEGTFMCGCP